VPKVVRTWRELACDSAHEMDDTFCLRNLQQCEKSHKRAIFPYTHGWLCTVSSIFRFYSVRSDSGKESSAEALVSHQTTLRENMGSRAPCTPIGIVQVVLVLRLSAFSSSSLFLSSLTRKHIKRAEVHVARKTNKTCHPTQDSPFWLSVRAASLTLLVQAC
jgi:hypothetical protein